MSVSAQYILLTVSVDDRFVAGDKLDDAQTPVSEDQLPGVR